MQYIKGLEAYEADGRSAVTLGKFDGLHLGHKKLTDMVKEYGRQDDIKSIVCAFDMSVLWEKKGISREVLMTKDERKNHLEEEVDCLVDCPFTEEFSRMEAEEFIENVICNIFRAAYVVVGTDFRFGHGKRGDIHMLQAYARKYDYELIVIEKERREGHIISSTYIKQILKEGNMPFVCELLGYPYGLQGVVEHGKKLGRRLGFPTFNVAPAREKVMPPNGVYLNRVQVDGVWYDGIANIGVKPTVSDEERLLVESYLFDYSGDAYGKEVQIELLEFCRPEQKFADVEEMKKCVAGDIAFGRQYFEMAAD
ncbi:bifunctional riboflavin kinase/FAD synthetase [[Clostridium] hylemonae]|uniref:Riboflavin biosynthesis protein n=3 Tax=[Clostridium] hylemonae TaxID=89153 RepID=C0C3P1_9FIRM|nr:bifunctional riboflavin kinase/FAD synthetase [[Clostridium] hylemonae]EEG73233.1 riboflavin biosynthesis protein RibF [[Clostridium] hylemonae DSM 15053]MCB7521005.1 bifunctional riboflavin kinase/FAD synthetase [[Clostridium] hylemonae]QEK17488.1 Riboflavin biosynthesis protein RibF [[Clostridium] hylemonae DSM 15053]